MFGDLLFYMFLFVINVVAFGLFGYDKHCATYRKWRIPEALLLVAAFAMGAFGSLCGMTIFHHKTSKSSFTVAVPLFLLLQVLGMAYFFTR